MRYSLRNGFRRRVRLSCCGAIAAAITLPAVEAPADIFTCVGPAREVLYSNIGCPPGYVLRAGIAEADAPPPAAAPPAASEEPPPPPEPAPLPRAKDAVDAQCFVGSFQTDESPGSIDVLFTNSGARACRRVRFYCLWGLGLGKGFYQQSGTGAYEGLIEPGATVRVGEMTPSGPAAGDVSWSWCSIR